MNGMELYAAVPAIVVLCYLGAELFKVAAPEKAYRGIPAVCMALGAGLGLLCAILWPDFIPAENPLVAAAIGVVSGLASTGVNQVFKQGIKHE